MTWTEAVLFFKFLAGGVATMVTTISLYLMLGFPILATQTYVNEKFQVASDAGIQTRTLVKDIQKQINRQSIQNLRLEKFKLEQIIKANPSDDTANRKLQEINGDLDDLLAERARLNNQ